MGISSIIIPKNYGFLGYFNAYFSKTQKLVAADQSGLQIWIIGYIEKYCRYQKLINMTVHDNFNTVFTL